jgi:hypothetical protein
MSVKKHTDKQRGDLISLLFFLKEVKSKVKQSIYTPWRRLGGEEV